MTGRQRFCAWFMLASFLVFGLMCRPAYAAESYQDSGFVEWPELPPEPLTPDEAMICLHEDVHFFVRGFVPFTCAVIIFVLGCVWFYCTFIKI